jgi:hypothetical protein
MLSSFFQKIISPIKEDFEAKKVLFTEDHGFLLSLANKNKEIFPSNILK